MSAPHFIAGAAYVRGQDGRTQTRSKAMRLRLEPALLEALKVRAEQTRGDHWPDGRGAGASAYVRALIVADLEAAGLLDRDGGYVQPVAEDRAGDDQAMCDHTSTAVAGEDRSVAELIIADLEATAERNPARARERLDVELGYSAAADVQAALRTLDAQWAARGF